MPNEPAPLLIVAIRPGTSIQTLEQLTRTRVIRASDFRASVPPLEEISASASLYLDHVGALLTTADPEKEARLYQMVRAANSPVLALDHSRTLRPLTGPAGPPPGGFIETTDTWGVQAVHANNCQYTGRGIRVAILDSGLDFAHQDFAGRGFEANATSFVPGEPDLLDRVRHGTACAGILCGPAVPKAPAPAPPRYGVAPGVDLYVGKVIRADRVVSDPWVIAGINWAVANGCSVVSMSIGEPVQRNQTFSATFEQIASNALNQHQCLLIAGTGNTPPQPVNHPADCPSVMAIGAIDQHYHLATFSCTGINFTGAVDFVAPGVDIISSTPCRPFVGCYMPDDGTSLATPFAAGVAALWAEKTGLRGQALWNEMVAHRLDIGLPFIDGGHGLVQSPCSPFPLSLSGGI